MDRMSSRLNDEEFWLLQSLLARYAHTDLDQWDNWQLDCGSAKVYVITSSSGRRSSIRSSLPARDVETQNHLDNRALPDRLRSLHRHLDRHQVAAIPGE